MVNMIEMLQKAVKMGGSDIFIIPGSCASVKVNNELVALNDTRLLPADSEKLVSQMYELAHRDIALLNREGDDDFSFAIKDVSRFRDRKSVV